MMGSDGSSSSGTFEGSGVPGAEARDASANAAAAVLMTEGYFELEQGLRAYQCEFVPEQPDPSTGSVIVLMHGYGEHCRRYDELSQHLARRGHVVCLFDARGHGRSQGQRGHVRHFADYVDDFAAFVGRVRTRYGACKLIVLGHSNGALIAVRSIQAGLTGVSGLVLTGPLLGLRKSRQAAPDGVARVLSAIAPRLPLPNGIRSEDLTRDPASREAHRQDRWVHSFATPRWYWSMTLAARDALLGAPRVTLPLLIVQGENDPIVEPLRVAEFYERAGSSDKRLVQRPGELHEVLNETARCESFDLIGAWIGRISAATFSVVLFSAAVGLAGCGASGRAREEGATQSNLPRPEPGVAATPSTGPNLRSSGRSPPKQAQRLTSTTASRTYTASWTSR